MKTATALFPLSEARRIGVFLSSRSALPESYHRAARETGDWIGRTGRTLVYGGARKGLMEELALHTRAAGGRVYGVVPQILTERGLVSECIDVAFHCTDLNDRKAVLMRESDVLVVLPGGIGTVDELFSILATGIIGLENKPVILLNADGCWDSLLALLDDLQHRGLADAGFRSQLRCVKNMQELVSLFENPATEC